jgi:hypothetical protein
MRTGRVAAVFAQGAVWRATGARAAANALVRAFGSDDEMVKSLAGMFLVRGGRGAAPVLRDALARGCDDPNLLTALADVGTREDEPLLRSYTRHADPSTADAARRALEVLALRGEAARR